MKKSEEMTADKYTTPWFKPVVTLDDAALEKVMKELWAKVGTTNVSPDCIVGIATGGLLCAEKLKPTVDIPVLSCALRRPGTKIKKISGIKRLLGIMPYGISNWMRRIEDRLLATRENKPSGTNPSESKQLSSDVETITRFVTDKGLRHVLVIDDAVDSGVTLGSVVAALRAALPPETTLTTAVITQTRSLVAFEPDVSLYRNTLCRFPWSFDFRGN
ncbi:phosphoribosyltransferase [Pseudorhodobacter sp.]|uniref:phosphoribosyltransferase n=1 Tax=Pseudorhodobacter sp. TaxID=1934400 RepID=UPI002AFE4EE2|nr:phosphoribosyltransferase [Pseudorhodobacter sp.]